MNTNKAINWWKYLSLEEQRIKAKSIQTTHTIISLKEIEILYINMINEKDLPKAIIWFNRLSKANQNQLITTANQSLILNHKNTIILELYYKANEFKLWLDVIKLL